MDVGNPDYWVTKAVELLMESKELNTFAKGNSHRDKLIKEAITLLILTRAKLNEPANASDSKKEKTKGDVS